MSIDELVKELQVVVMSMPPHISQRKHGKLIIASLAAIKKLLAEKEEHHDED